MYVCGRTCVRSYVRMYLYTAHTLHICWLMLPRALNTYAKKSHWHQFCCPFLFKANQFAHIVPERSTVCCHYCSESIIYTRIYNIYHHTIPARSRPDASRVRCRCVVILHRMKARERCTLTHTQIQYVQVVCVRVRTVLCGSHHNVCIILLMKQIRNKGFGKDKLVRARMCAYAHYTSRSIRIYSLRRAYILVYYNILPCVCICIMPYKTWNMAKRKERGQAT